MTLALLFLAILVLGTTALLVFGRGRAAGAPGAGLDEAPSSLPPVFLPERPGAADVRDVRFSLAFRGYRCDQVDEVIDALSAEIERLKAERGNGEDPCD
ncbi:DivIVA domain-containing protein [Zhihengliuella sp.]|uniref:DivIVA domain-containing protein n=1 Tax=Zhihengliuella sp. TaxID=1954483 RepID=UPI002810C0A9|nr:DivIVA domain-containing protein [Zhihengliuella sp.]